MNRWQTKRVVEKNRVIALKADKTQTAPEVDALLIELGNDGKSIPFYAVFPSDGGPPITFDGIISQTDVLTALQRAGPSKQPSTSTAMK